jgi:hypothetical protein
LSKSHQIVKHVTFGFFFFASLAVAASRYCSAIVLSFFFVSLELSFSFCFFRHHLGVHSWEQIGVGAFVGSAFATIWVYIVTPLLRSFVAPRLYSNSCCQFFLIRDSEPVPNVARLEYQLTRDPPRVAVALPATKPNEIKKTS